jgi:hypothetical protein
MYRYVYVYRYVYRYLYVYVYVYVYVNMNANVCRYVVCCMCMCMCMQCCVPCMYGGIFVVSSSDQIQSRMARFTADNDVQPRFCSWWSVACSSTR